MFLSRREFLQHSGKAAAALWIAGNTRRQPTQLRPTLDPNSLTPFVDPLPIPPIARPDGYRPSAQDSALRVPYYRLPMRQFQSKVHRDMKPTQQWGIGGTCPGPTLEARSKEGVFVEWANELPSKHFLPVDHKLHGAEPDKPEVRTVIHLHGARVRPENDGYPESWYVPGKSATYFYPNDQDATLLWYHDHAVGINRLNVFAGLFGTCILRDPIEDSLNLPKGQYEVPLVIYDRSFDTDGQLSYPVSPDPAVRWIPEFFGNAILVNGRLLPYLDVDPRKYRLRLLNAANGRFFHLSLSNEGDWHQIGADQGLLPAPVTLRQVTLAPAERADVILDFTDHAGAQIVMNNDFSVPVMQFRVAKTKVSDTSSLPATLRSINKLKESDAVKTRSMGLWEWDDPAGNPTQMLLNNAHWNMPITENPVLNSVEIWNLINTTDDSHPIHLHLVRFQILDRQRFDSFAYRNEKSLMRYLGQRTPPELGEAGWKDTVRAEPNMITRIIIPFEGFVGRYVWHCHILEHEDNEMMRPFEVVAPK